MNLTEPGRPPDVVACIHEGRPIAGDGTYLITGAPRSSSSCSLASTSHNIVHLRWVWLPRGPRTKGISLFIVPKFMVGDDGSSVSANRRAVRVDRAQDELHALADLRDGGDDGGRSATWSARRTRHAGHVHDDGPRHASAVGIQGAALGDAAYQGAGLLQERRQGRGSAATPSRRSSSPTRRAADAAVHAQPRRGRCGRSSSANAAARPVLRFPSIWRRATAWGGSPEPGSPRSPRRTDVGMRSRRPRCRVFGGMGCIEERPASPSTRDMLAPSTRGVPTGSDLGSGRPQAGPVDGRCRQRP